MLKVNTLILNIVKETSKLCCPFPLFAYVIERKILSNETGKRKGEFAINGNCFSLKSTNIDNKQ